MDPTKIPIRATTQEHLDIEDILDNLVILKDGSVCLILKTTAVNFGLLSEPEQDATIYAYAGLLNSLTFPIQIVIKSQRKDVSSYLSLLKKEEEKQKNPIIKDRIKKYRYFVENTVSVNNVLDKNFYLIIPFYRLELGLKSAGNVFKKGLPYPKSYILEMAKTALYPKRDHLIRQFNRIGLKVIELTTKQLIEMFFKAYNPDSIGAQQLTNVEEYTKPLVEAATEKVLQPKEKSQEKPEIFPEKPSETAKPQKPLDTNPIAQNVNTTPPPTFPKRANIWKVEEVK